MLELNSETAEIEKAIKEEESVFRDHLDLGRKKKGGVVASL